MAQTDLSPFITTCLSTLICDIVLKTNKIIRTFPINVHVNSLHHFEKSVNIDTSTDNLSQIRHVEARVNLRPVKKSKQAVINLLSRFSSNTLLYYNLFLLN